VPQRVKPVFGNGYVQLEADAGGTVVADLANKMANTINASARLLKKRHTFEVIHGLAKSPLHCAPTKIAEPAATSR
jgi:hypothetical protein